MGQTLKVRIALLAGLAMTAVAASATFIPQEVKVARASDNRTLTVRYSKAKAVLVELRVNGATMATRTVSDEVSAGETNFTLDTTKMKDGANTVEIRLFDAQGNVIATDKSDVILDRSATGPVFLNKPKSGDTVQGYVDISVGFKSELRNSYVSFFIDDEFKALKNYPPYSFLWDTSRVDNGWHEVEAWVVDEASNTYRTERMKVFVNNPGGRTPRMTFTPVPTKVEPAKPAPAKANPAKAVTAKPETAKPVAKAPSNTVLTEAVPEPKLALSGRTGAKEASVQPGTMTSERLMRPTGLRTAGSKATSTDLHTPNVSAPGVPKISAVKVESSVPATAAPSKVSNPVEAPAPTALVSVSRGSKLPDIGYYPIYVNGTPVKFDVMPRVEEGVALTPFRHLFEHAGGKVGWSNATKTVEAQGLGLEIGFTIGQSFAKVNGGRIDIERASFLEGGRAIVPLSFVQQLLNVDIKYDPATKHVLVTKVK